MAVAGEPLLADVPLGAPGYEACKSSRERTSNTRRNESVGGGEPDRLKVQGVEGFARLRV